MQGSLVGLVLILIVPPCTLSSRKQKVYWTVEMSSLDKRRGTSIVHKSWLRTKLSYLINDKSFIVPKKFPG